MSTTKNKKVSKAEVGRIVDEGLDHSDATRLNGLETLMRFRTSKIKIQTREENRLAAKYGNNYAGTQAVNRKLNANSQFVSGLKMEVHRADARSNCDDRSWIVTGRVYDKNACPVSDAELTLYNADGKRVEAVDPVKTDRQGVYRIRYSSGKASVGQPPGEAAGGTTILTNADQQPSGTANGDTSGARRLSSGLRINSNSRYNGDFNQQAVFLTAVSETNTSICSESTLMIPKLGQCSYRDIILNLDLSEKLVSDVEKDRRSSRYLGNSATRELHDLKNEKLNCQIDEIRIDRCVRFKSVKEAHSLDYDMCAYCFSKSQSRR